MGCSPSKGQLFSGHSGHHDKELQFNSYESNSDFSSNGTEPQSKTEVEGVSTELMSLEEESTLVPPQGKRPSQVDVECNTTTDFSDAGKKVLNLQEGLLSQDKSEAMAERKKRNKEGKRKRLRKNVHVQSKVDVLETIVRSQQAAYAYLYPNISKYESLLGLLDQATRTQLSLQPVAGSLVLRYEEINQALEDITVEGEQMLEEHGNHMARSAAQRHAQCNPAKPDIGLTSPEPPPDLLQQMLHDSFKKIRLVGDSVKGLGDSALEEAAEYFASLSRLLEEKLVVKRETEARLNMVLARVEAVALRKPSSEDSALHSEDSGICVDNECQRVSMRLHRHRESSGSGASTGSSSVCAENTFLHQFASHAPKKDNHDNNDDEDDDDNDDDDDDGNDDNYDDDERNANDNEEEPKDEQGKEADVTNRKVTNCAQEDTNQNSFQVCLQNYSPVNITLDWTNHKDRNIRRPKTADSPPEMSLGKPRHIPVRCPRRSRSVDCLFSKVDEYMLKGPERNLNGNEKGSSKTIGVGGKVISRARLRRHSSGGQSAARCYGLQYGSKGPFKASIPPSSPPALVPAPPGRNAVKRLIDTFSQGAQDNSNQKSFNGPLKARGKRCFLPTLSNSRGVVSTNDNNNNNSYPFDQRFSDRPEDVDVESLPPPPLEILMDNSFESSEDPTGDEENSETQFQGSTTRRQRYGVSERLRALQTVTVLPSRATVPRGSLRVSLSRPVRQDGLVLGRPGQDCDQQIIEKEETVNLYQQSRKIIHLSHSTDPATKGQGDQSMVRNSSVKVGAAVRKGSKELEEGEALAPYPNSHPPTTPPVSRARLPPSCPSARHRIPSPPALPPSPAYPVKGQWGTSITPLSPNIQIWTRGNSDEENGLSRHASMSFYDARSVFCQETQTASISQTPSCRSTLPRPWGEPSRGILQTARLPHNFRKSSPSDQQTRSVFTDQQQSNSQTMQPNSTDNEPTTLSQERRDSTSLTEVTQHSEKNTPVDPVTDPQASESVPETQEVELGEITDKQD